MASAVPRATKRRSRPMAAYPGPEAHAGVRHQTVRLMETTNVGSREVIRCLLVAVEARSTIALSKRITAPTLHGQSGTRAVVMSRCLHKSAPALSGLSAHRQALVDAMKSGTPHDRTPPQTVVPRPALTAVWVRRDDRSRSPAGKAALPDLGEGVLQHRPLAVVGDVRLLRTAADMAVDSDTAGGQPDGTPAWSVAHPPLPLSEEGQILPDADIQVLAITGHKAEKAVELRTVQVKARS